MRKTAVLIAVTAAVLGLGTGFYLHAVVARHGFSAPAFVGHFIRLKSEPPTAPAAADPFSYRVIAPVYAALNRHAALVMLGDSITAFTDWNALLPSFDVANRGIPEDTTEGVLKRIDSIIAMYPRCVAVMLGINDLRAGRSVHQISEKYNAIVERLSASGATVIVQSTLLTSQFLAQLNASVIQVDRSLDEMCTQSGRCRYIDLNSTLAPTGAMADTIDGLHIGPNSYKLWARALTPLLNPHCR
jgi:lysophospholipase L1-like esterase